MKRLIMHIDMDAFYASVEQRDHPEYRGKPVIVGADPENGRGRGVVSAASYEARKFGVHSALPISKAWQRCPDGIFLSVRGKQYAQVSRRIMAIFRKYTPCVEPISLDEAFLDFTGLDRLWGDVEKTGRALKSEILAKEDLTASVGIGPNKLIAKIASDLEKPDGFVAVKKDDVLAFLNPLPVRKLWGVGKKMEERLKQLDIHTIGQLAKYPERSLQDHFGKMGQVLSAYARGEDDSPVVAIREIKSISNETTFQKDVSDTELIRETILKLAEKVGYRLRRKDMCGKTLFLKIRFSDFSTYVRHASLRESTSLSQVIFQECVSLYHSLEVEARPVRLVGVGVTHLTSDAACQTDLFQRPTEKQKKLNRAVDDLKNRYGESIIQKGKITGRRKFHSGI